MLKIEVGKVYRLKNDGLFVASYRHENNNDDRANHWVFKRITKGNSYEGFGDPVVFDYDLEWRVCHEAKHADYLEYRMRYRREIAKLSNEAQEYQCIIEQLSGEETKNGGRVV